MRSLPNRKRMIFMATQQKLLLFLNIRKLFSLLFLYEINNRYLKIFALTTIAITVSVLVIYFTAPITPGLYFRFKTILVNMILSELLIYILTLSQ